MALLLRRRGIQRVRPLAGGFDGWRSAGFPLERHAASEPELTQISPLSAEGDRPR